MTPPTRAAIVFLIAALGIDRNRAGVYDHSRGRFIGIALGLSRSQALLFSATESIHIRAQIRPSIIHLQDLNTNSHLHLRIHKNTFSGHDERSNSGFAGNVDRNVITLRDQDGEQYLVYTV